MSYKIRDLSIRLMLFIFFVRSAVAQTADEFYPASSNLLNSEYPKVSADSRVSVRLRAPGADA